MILVTSDTHFGHTNIIRYCSRPFANSTDMDEWLINRWNSRVTTDDVVYHLGDFVFGKPERILSRLNGKIYLVPGNHDKQMRRLWNDPFLGPCGFTMLSPIEEIVVEEQRFVLCHFPLADWEGSKDGTIHLHGHRHTQFALFKGIEDRSYDVGVDMYGGPIELTGDLRHLKNPKGWQ